LRTFIGRRSRRLVITVAALFAVAGGVAYATIPDAAGVYTACKLNALGTIRLIDPSGPATSLLSHCTALETSITWSHTGPQGIQGIQGTQGIQGPQGPEGPAGAAAPTQTFSTYTNSYNMGISSFYAGNKTGYVSCYYPDVLTGGGFDTNNVDIKASAPNGNNGWFVTANGGLSGGNVWIYAQCLHVQHTG
jgi:hypothetical protein